MEADLTHLARHIEIVNVPSVLSWIVLLSAFQKDTNMFNQLMSLWRGAVGSASRGAVYRSWALRAPSITKIARYREKFLLIMVQIEPISTQ